MPSFNVKLDTQDSGLGFDLLGTKKFGQGVSADVLDGVHVSVDELYVRKALGAAATITLTISVAAGVPAGVVANWLFSKLKGRTVHLRIEHREVEMTEGEVTRVIEDIIELSDE